MMLAKRKCETERLAQLQLARSENVGPITYQHLVRTYGSASQALAELPRLAANGGLKRKILICPKDVAQAEFDEVAKIGAELLFIGDVSYPKELAKIADAPSVLTALGKVSKLNSYQGVAVVGSRAASINSINFCSKLVQELEGFNIVSGLALGIDAAAHKAASFTTAVIAGGVDYIYPLQNSDLYHHIKEHGVILSESRVKTPPVAQSFPKRNRIISGIARAVIVIEAALKSGTLITARNAITQQKILFAVPGSPYDVRAAGSNQLIKNGALLLERASDIKEALKKVTLFDSAPNVNSYHSGGRVPDESEIAVWRPKIVQSITTSFTNVDDIERHLNAPKDVLLIVMLELELAGNIERGFGNAVRRIV